MRFSRAAAYNSLVYSVLMALSAGPSRADLLYEFIEVDGNVIIQTSGSLSFLPPPSAQFSCNDYVGFMGRFRFICTGNRNHIQLNMYVLNFLPFASLPFAYNHFLILQASASSGVPLVHDAHDTPFDGLGGLGLHPDYILGEPIISSATLRNVTVNDMFPIDPPPESSVYTLSTWRLEGTNELVILKKEVPSPLPLLGAAGIYPWIRRLRQRIRSSEP